MTTMFDEAIIRHFFDLLNDRNLETMADILHKEAVFLFPKTRPLEGSDRILRFFSILFKQYPELRFEIRDMILRGPKAAVHWTDRGINHRGQSYENEGVTWLDFKENLIIHISNFFKDTEKF